MNRLFLGLLVAGVVLVIGVLVYNWLQERGARRRIGRGAPRAGGGREYTEPSLRRDDTAPELPANALAAAPVAAAPVGAAPADAEDDLPLDGEPPDEPLPQPLAAAHGPLDGSAPDRDIECVVLLRPGARAPGAALAPVAGLTHPMRWLGRRSDGIPWQPLAAAAGPWPEIAACLLLADRSGAASRADIEAFLQAVAAAATTLGAPCALPDPADEAARAEELDQFCADLDVQIGLTIVKGEQGQIAGTRLRGVAEAAGFRLNARGQFEYRDEVGRVLCSLQHYKQEPLTVESLRVLTLPGIVLLIDVPRVADPVQVFDQIRLIAKRLAVTLEGVLVDDNRRPLDDAALAAIRGQVQATAAALRAAHIEPGGTRALRLFG